MKLVVCKSGSDGNTYLLNSDNDCVILDCGVNTRLVMKMLNFKVMHIKFALCTHIHNDHSKYIKDYIRMGIRVYMPPQVKEQYEDSDYAIPVEPMKKFKDSGFTVIPFEVPHDKDVVCYAYIIEHEDFGKLLYMTDCMYCRYNLKPLKINYFLVECNHMKEFLDENYEMGLRNRVLATHMELKTTKGFIQANKSSELRNVILCHMSDGNMDISVMEKEISEVAGKRVKVSVAESGLSLELSRFPF